VSLVLPSVHPEQDLPASVTVYEVGARDGLQAEAGVVPTELKVSFIRELLAAGLDPVEATSFVSPKWVPQLADAVDVVGGLEDLSKHPVLVPNMRGFERARDAGAEVIAVFVSATETFAQRNLNTTRDDAVKMAQDVVAAARESQIRVRGYVSMCFGDPWEGVVEPAEVAAVTKSLLDAGCYEVSLGDTIGVGTPGHVRDLLARHADEGIGAGDLALHFHDTYGQALANVLSGLRAGVTCFDASAGGIGGCPFAGSATGNLATEDLLWMLHGLGIETGVDLAAVVRAGRTVTDFLLRPPSRIATALEGRI
jgi:hydroxymethylglutaryl-CoA lyase